MVMPRSDHPSSGHPVCPITGEPALRLVQSVSVALLNGLWRVSHGVSTVGVFSGIPRFRLWESPCGLAFFDPMIAGDADFYHHMYGRMKLHAVLTGAEVQRPEFDWTAALVAPGASVLDVGGGEGGLSRHLPHARYTAIDPNAQGSQASIDLRRETVAEHAAGQAGHYDVVCALQVLEHVAEPLAFATDMVTCLKPGGLLIIGVPLWPSPMTAIPNLAFNAPPHHLTWWTAQALRALAGRLGLDVESVEPVSIGSHDSILYWMGRLSPNITGGRFFRARWGWYAALAWSWAAGRVANALFTPPPDAAPLVLVLSARKPP